MLATDNIDMSTDRKKLRVFVAYAKEDLDRLKFLVEKLRSDGFDPWWDRAKLFSGDKWEEETKKAIAQADAIICCFSQAALKNTGFFRKEVEFARDRAKELPEGTRFLFPVQLKPCNRIPRWLKDLHCESLADRDGYSKLRQMLLTKACELQCIAAPIPTNIPEGAYTAIGNNPDRQPYCHNVQIQRVGDQFKITWILAENKDKDETVVGWAVIQDTTLLVTSPEWMFAYDIHADGTLSGEWGRGAFERLTRKSV